MDILSFPSSVYIIRIPILKTFLWNWSAKYDQIWIEGIMDIHKTPFWVQKHSDWKWYNTPLNKENIQPTNSIWPYALHIHFVIARSLHFKRPEWKYGNCKDTIRHMKNIAKKLLFLQSFTHTTHASTQYHVCDT